MFNRLNHLARDLQRVRVKMFVELWILVFVISQVFWSVKRDKIIAESSYEADVESKLKQGTRSNLNTL